MPLGPLFASATPLPNCIPISDGSASLQAWVTNGSSPGTVTSVSIGSANGFTGSVTNPTTTPFITIGTTVSGILFGNGTGVAAAIAANFPTLNQNTTGSAATLTTPRSIFGASFNGSADLGGPVAVAFGGTGLATLTANNVMLGNGTGTPLFVAPGTSGNVLTSNGTTWTSAPAAGGGGTPGGSTTQLQYNNAGAFGGIAGSAWNGTALTLPSNSVAPASGGAFYTVSAIAGQNGYFGFANASSPGGAIGQAGASNQIITGSTVNDICYWLNGTGRMIFSTATSGSSIGLGLETANAGISWGGSTSGTVPVKSSLTVFPASGLALLQIQGVAGQTALINLVADNNSPAVTQIGTAGSANSILNGSAVGDVCVKINGSGQRFVVGTQVGSPGGIGFGVATANGGIFTSDPSGGTAANWKLGIAATVSPTAPNRTIQLDVGGILYYLHAKTTND